MRESVLRAFLGGPVELALASLGFLVLLSSVFPQRGAALAPDETARLTGPASVVDGDTIDVAGERVRLEGIDAPELAQTCPARYLGGLLGPWRCGQESAAALRRLIGRGEVACEIRGRDKYGRAIGVCRQGGRDVNAAMVAGGHAWAFVKYSDSYVAEEAEARKARAGIWASATEPQPAWDYRASRWASAGDAAPEGCAIKGNIARGERIYHVPWSPWYGKVRIDARAGERWFCDEAEAQAAGFRPARFQ